MAQELVKMPFRLFIATCPPISCQIVFGLLLSGSVGNSLGFGNYATVFQIQSDWARLREPTRYLTLIRVWFESWFYSFNSKITHISQEIETLRTADE